MAQTGNWTEERTATQGTGDITVSGVLSNDNVLLRDSLQAGEIWATVANGNNREAGVYTFDGVDVLQRTTIHATYENGVYNTSNPTPINLSGASVVSCTFNTAAFQELEIGSPLVDGYVLSSTIAGVRTWIDVTSGGVTSWGAITGDFNNQADLINNFTVELANVATLRATDGVTDGRTVSLVGYTTNGDGGGGEFYWDAASTATDDGGTIFKVTAVTTGRWIRSVSDVINAKMFGVKADGTDDTARQQAAIDYCVANDLQLYNPAGDYALESGLTVTLPNNTLKGFAWSCDGRGVTRFFYSGAGAMPIMLEIIPTGFALNVNLKGFQMDLSGAPIGSIGLRWNDGAWRSHCDDLYIHRDFIDNTGRGVEMGTNNPAGVGVFDTKWTNMYIAAFDINFNAIGTDHSGNTITNLTIGDGYISSGRINFNCEFYNGVYIYGSQLEAHSAYGFNTVNGDTAVITGGSIESPGVNGAHTGANNAAILTVTGKNWAVDQFVGLTVANETDGSEGVITANTATTITATLAGGTDDDWDTTDLYRIHSIGINVDADTKSVTAICDFFNNFGGHFVIDPANTRQGFLYKTSASGFVYPNSKLQLGTAGAGAAQIEFIRSGTDLGSISPALASSAIAVRDSSDAEVFKLDTGNGIIDVLKANGRIRLINESNYIEFFNGTQSVIDRMGTGTPEGVLAGNVGSTFRRRDGGAGTSFYVKESGTGNTGWVGK